MRFPDLRYLTVILTAVAILPSADALADAIDGDWCFGVRHLAISGPDIKTPGGSRMTGNYDRHAFAYVVPAGETGAGQSVTMQLQDDDHMTLRQGAAKAQLWTRCQAPTS